MSWKNEVEGIEARRELAKQLGGEEAVAKQHERGKLTIRERIDGLVDQESFSEQGPLAGHAETDEDGNLISFTPGNYILGLAKIDGRPCAVGGEDFTQRGGSPTASDRLLATQFGHKALNLLMAGESGQMAAWRNGKISSAPLDRATRRVKRVPKNHALIAAARSVGTCFGDEEC